MPTKNSIAGGRTAQGRTHRAMRENMQARLIKATVQVLVERGYSHASVQAICDAAGVTKGALFRHYDKRTDLLAAAADNIFTLLITNFSQRFARLTPGPDLGLQTVHLLRAHMADPLMRAAQELQMAARTDAVLQAKFGPVLKAYLDAAHQLAGHMFPNASTRNPDFAAVIDVFLDALTNEAATGAVLNAGQASGQDEDSDEGVRQSQRLAFLARLADQEILIHEPQLTAKP
ncbi:MAG: helix-turn-helix domain-containing protein [Pseudomonadota bacterium]